MTAQQAESGHAGAKVTVACKHPAGLTLRVFQMVEDQEPILGGGYRKFKRAEQVGESIDVHGNAVAFGARPSHMIIGDYALTPNVDKDFFDLWLKQNADHPMVKNELIFAYERPDMASDRAREQDEVRSGLEPLAQDKDPRAPRRIQRSESKAA